jgi:glycerate kinase
MKIVIAADKFKGSLSSFQACDAIARGLRQADPHFTITQLPLSDGGDGLAEVMAYYVKTKKITATVYDPLWRPVQASYLLSEDGRIAILEMAQASGLMLLQPHEYNPLLTTTFGTGQLIAYALQQGVSKIVLGIGGSATTDCGIGMAAALGYQFYDAAGRELKPIGANLIHIETIDAVNKISLNGIAIEVACDVTNHLTGESGAAKMYAPQKGATPEMVATLEAGMLHFASVVQRDFHVDLNTIKSGGAAGGLGAGCVFFLNALLRRGVELLLDYSEAETHIREADFIITGEGKLDAQSLHGKVVQGVATVSAKYDKPAIALCGIVDVDSMSLREAGLAAAFSIINKPMSLNEALAQAEDLLTEAAFNIGNFFKTSYRL